MTVTPGKYNVVCLNCEGEIEIGRNPKVGQYVDCDNCDMEFRIVSINPIEIEWPYEDDDDFVDYDFGDDNDADY